MASTARATSLPDRPPKAARGLSVRADKRPHAPAPEIGLVIGYPGHGMRAGGRKEHPAERALREHDATVRRILSRLEDGVAGSVFSRQPAKPVRAAEAKKAQGKAWAPWTP